MVIKRIERCAFAYVSFDSAPFGYFFAEKEHRLSPGQTVFLLTFQSQSLQFARQRTKQAVVEIIREKESNSRPTMKAPMMLVAANVIARRRMENRIVPRMPANKTANVVQRQER